MAEISISALDRALDALACGGAPEDVASAASAEAEALLDRREGLAALEVLVRAERELGSGFGGIRGGGLGIRHVERARVHALLGLRERVDRLLPAIRRAVALPDGASFPEAAVRALRLEVERASALSRALVELGWYALAASVLERAELPLGYLGEHPPQRFEWLRHRASWAFAAREIAEARRVVREYHALLESAPLPEGETDRLIDDLHGWLDVAPVRALIADLAVRVEGDPRREARLVAWDVASALFFPWDEALEAELESRLKDPDPTMLEALIDRVGESLAARAALSPDQLPRPALVEDSGRVLALLDRLTELADAAGAPELALRAALIAHEQMIDVLAALRPDALAVMHPVDSARVAEVLGAPPWSREARAARVAALRARAGVDPEPRARAALVADPMLAPAEACALAAQVLDGPPDEQRLDLAAALVDRLALVEGVAGHTEQPSLALATRWLEDAIHAPDRALAMEAREILAGAREIAGDPAGALVLFEELSAYFEARDHDRWVRAVERTSMLAKQTGRLSSAGRAARSGFRPGGKVQSPAGEIPATESAMAAEEQAERSIAVALRTTDPEVGEAWLRRALALYERVPDGRRREDEIWERIADLWQAEADALFESGDATSEQLDEAHRRAHEALVRAIEVGEDLGDGERVFELSGRVLDVLWTWLTRWEDALDAFLSLAQGRFRSAVERGDLDHAAAARLELRAHLADVEADASELESPAAPSGSEAGGPADLVRRFAELEQEMGRVLAEQTERIGEPWWVERLERREALMARRYEQRSEDERE